MLVILNPIINIMGVTYGPKTNPWSLKGTLLSCTKWIIYVASKQSKLLLSKSCVHYNLLNFLVDIESSGVIIKW
jgi:hypothetical protein